MTEKLLRFLTVFFIFMLIAAIVVYAPGPGPDDADGDGVADATDKCPNSLTNAVDQLGCTCAQKLASNCPSDAQCCQNDNNPCTDDCGLDNVGKAVCNYADNNNVCNGGRCSNGRCITQAVNQIVSVGANPLRTVVIITNAKQQNSPVNVEDARKMIFEGRDDGKSANDWIYKNSFGQVSLSPVGIGVYGPFNLNLGSSCNYNEQFNAAKNAAASQINYGQVDRIIIFSPWVCDAARGRASLPNERPQWSMLYVADLGVLLHELSHNFNLGHDGRCTDWPACTAFEEHGDFTSPTGTSSDAHLNAMHKETLGWIRQNNIATINTISPSGNRIFLEPIEVSTQGIQNIKIKRRDGKYYTLTYRDNRDYDINLARGVYMYLDRGGGVTAALNYENLGEAPPIFTVMTPKLRVGGSPYIDDINNIQITLESADSNGASLFIGPVGSSPTPSPSLSVTSPNGGETLRVGSNTIRWTSSQNIPPTQQVSINLISESGQPNPLPPPTPNSGNREVTIPASTTPGRYKVEIKTNVNGNDFSDQSDDFFNVVTAAQPVPLSANPSSVTLAVGQQQAVMISGGTPAYQRTVSPSPAPTNSFPSRGEINGNVLTVTANSEGSNAITITDSASPVNSLVIPVTVIAATCTPTTRRCNGNDLMQRYSEANCPDKKIKTCENGCSGNDCNPPPPALCGNGQIDSGEVCDGNNLNDKTCRTEGFSSGTLRCSSDCQSFDTSQCIGVQPLRAEPSSVSVRKNEQRTATIMGGTSPYAIKSFPDSSKATAALSGDELIISGVNEGSTTITIKDSSTPEKNVQIQIQVTPALPSNDPCTGVVCNTQRPEGPCIGNFKNVYSSQGTCSNGECSYPSTSVGCITVSRVSFIGDCSENSRITLKCISEGASQVKLWAGECRDPSTESNCLDTISWWKGGVLYWNEKPMSASGMNTYTKNIIINQPRGSAVAATCRAYTADGTASNWGDSYPLCIVN